MHHEVRGPHRGRLSLVAFASLWTLTLIFAVPAFAQDQYDCASFGSQESAQAELDRDPSDPSNLDADNDGQACEDYDYGTTGESPQGGGEGGDLDCADFATQEEAQAEFDADPTDPNRLDADSDGQACEDHDYGVATDQRLGGNADDQYADRREDVIPGTFKKRPLPVTGGPPLLVAAWAFAFVGAGVALLRRS